MILGKKNIYNAKLHHVATEVIISENNMVSISEAEREILYMFISVLADEVNASKDKPLVVIFPVTYMTWLEELANDLRAKLMIYWLISSTENIQDRTAQYSLRLNATTVKASIDEAVELVFIEAPMVDRYKQSKSSLGKTAKEIVSNVHNYDELQKIKGLDFQLYQGDFVLSAQVNSKSPLPTNKMGVLNLIAMLNDPAMNITQLTDVITKDSVLSYKLLQMVNSPVFRGMMEVKSIQQAIVRFGFGNLKKWVMMLTLCHNISKPASLVNLTLARAFMCQSLAENGSAENHGDVAYTVGLLSTLDAFMDRPMDFLLESTALSDEIKKAILFNEGPYGRILETVVAYQKGLLKGLESTLVKIYIDSSTEVNEILNILQNP